MASTKQEIFRVLKAQSGNKVALNELFETLQEPLYRYILTIIKEPSLAEDILQEVFVLIYRKIYWLRQAELFRPWAYRIASREAFKWLKSEGRWREQVRDETILEDIPSSFADEQFVRELDINFPKLLEGLSPASRAVIVLHYVHEMTLEEISEVLDIAIGTVKSRLSYGLKLLRKEFEKQTI